MLENELIEFFEDEINGLEKQKEGVFGDVACKEFFEINGEERISKFKETIEMIKEINQYRALGSVEAIREAMEKTRDTTSEVV